MATAVHLELTRARSVCFAGAGHPPPVLRLPSTAAPSSCAARRPPRSASCPTPAITSTRSALPAGATLLVYTDGLVDRPDTSLTNGLSDLRDAVASGPADPEELCEHILRTLLPNGPPGDDIALLALQSVPIGGEALHPGRALRRQRAGAGAPLALALARGRRGGRARRLPRYDRGERGLHERDRARLRAQPTAPAGRRAHRGRRRRGGGARHGQWRERQRRPGRSRAGPDAVPDGPGRRDARRRRHHRAPAPIRRPRRTPRDPGSRDSTSTSTATW